MQDRLLRAIVSRPTESYSTILKFLLETVQVPVCVVLDLTSAEKAAHPPVTTRVNAIRAGG
jgi:hypothetical protein